MNAKLIFALVGVFLYVVCLGIGLSLQVQERNDSFCPPDEVYVRANVKGGWVCVMKGKGPYRRQGG